MKSRISFFNATIFRRDITRFYPVWLIYSLIICLRLLTDLGDNYSPIVESVYYSISPFIAYSFFFAPLVALTLFTDLFKSRQCNGLHALPVRRETLFCSHALAGALFILVPNLFCSLVYMVKLGEYWYISLIWLGATSLSFISLYGIALFSVMMVGKSFAMLLVYFGVNFLTYIIAGVYYSLYEPLLYGLSSSGSIFNYFCPIAMLGGAHPIVVSAGWDGSSFLRITFYPEAWLCLVLYALVGVGLAAIGLLAYRKRHLESAGDFLAANWLKPVFTVVFPLGLALVLYLWSSVFTWGEAFIWPFFLFLPVGYFAAQMLLRRSTRVFGKRSWLGLGALAAAIALTLGLTALDPLDITGYVPKADQVKSVSVRNSAPFTQEEDVEKVVALHQAILEQKALNKSSARAANSYEYYIGSINMRNVTLDYTLTNGKTVYRTYSIPLNSPAGKLLEPLLGSPEYVFRNCAYKDWDSFTATIETILVDNIIYIPQEDWPSLLEALRADFDAGRLIQDEAYHGNVDESERLTLLLPVSATESQHFNLDLWEDSLALQWIRDKRYDEIHENSIIK